MERFFGTWYENKFIDAGVKTALFVVVVGFIIWIFGILGKAPIYRLKDFTDYLWQPVLMLVIGVYVCFFFAARAHRKYRYHLSQRAENIIHKLNEKKASKRR